MEKTKKTGGKIEKTRFIPSRQNTTRLQTTFVPLIPLIRHK